MSSQRSRKPFVQAEAGDMFVIPAHWQLRQGDGKFKASLGINMRSEPKKPLWCWSSKTRSLYLVTAPRLAFFASHFSQSNRLWNLKLLAMWEAC